MQGKKQKKRGGACYQKKIDRRTKQWDKCPKLQEKIPLAQWLSCIKKPNAN